MFRKLPTNWFPLMSKKTSAVLKFQSTATWPKLGNEYHEMDRLILDLNYWLIIVTIITSDTTQVI